MPNLTDAFSDISDAMRAWMSHREIIRGLHVQYMPGHIGDWPPEWEVAARVQQSIDEAIASEIETLRALIAEADRAVVWETVMPDGAAYQERVEAALTLNQRFVTANSP